VSHNCGPLHWQTTSEVVRAALQLLEHRETIKQAEIEQARALIEEGAAQLDLGETLTDEQFFREWDEELAELQRPRTA
jgi:Arc/MetJ-type ribon-helix-helix transcriptional regulator